MYPSLTSNLSSILRWLDRRGFELIRRKKDRIASGVFTRNAPACEAFREIFFGSERKKKTRIKSPKFLLTVYLLASTNRTVNGYTLFQLFLSKNLEKTKLFVCSGIPLVLWVPIGTRLELK